MDSRTKHDIWIMTVSTLLTVAVRHYRLSRPQPSALKHATAEGRNHRAPAALSVLAGLTRGAITGDTFKEGLDVAGGRARLPVAATELPEPRQRCLLAQRHPTGQSRATARGAAGRGDRQHLARRQDLRAGDPRYPCWR